MIDYILSNFNWVTFLVALAVFVLVSNIYNLILSYIRARGAKEAAREAEEKLSQLQKQLKDKDQELGRMLSKEEKK
jgi:hypothetical protein